MTLIEEAQTSIAVSESRSVFAGVDTHKDTHHVAIVDELGRPIADREFLAVGSGYRQTLSSPRLKSGRARLDKSVLLGTGENESQVQRDRVDLAFSTYGLLVRIRDSIIVYVNIKAPTLAPLFRSDAQGELLATLFLNPERSFTISELARAAHTPYASAHREVSRIAEMGLATTTKRGQSVEVQARRDTPVFRPLAELLGFTYGPAVVIPNYLAGIPGIEAAYIYGSWAARQAGEPGDTPGDIDLLIVGNPPRGDVYEAVRLAGSAIAREVNPRIVSVEQWAAADDPFLRTLAQRPILHLDIKEPLS